MTPTITAGSFWIDRKGEKHGPMITAPETVERYGAHFYEGGPFNGKYSRCWSKDGDSLDETDLDLITECDKHGNRRREEPQCPRCHDCRGTGIVPNGCVGYQSCQSCGGAGSQPQINKSNPWFHNDKGLQPVADDVLVDVEYVEGKSVGVRAGDLYWHFDKSIPTAITAYRPHVEAKEVEGANPKTYEPNYCAHANIENGEIVIRVPLDTLDTVIEGAWATCNLSLRYKLTDATIFAKELCDALNDEEEDGTTPIHRLFDKCIEAVIESGADGIEEHEEQDA